jgi:hypothetical protein
MRAIRTSLSILLASILAAVFAQAAAAYDAAEMYDPGEVVFIDLTLAPTAKADLEAEPEEYVSGTFSLTRSSNGTPAGEEASPVLPVRAAEIRLKGSVGGSFRNLTEKAGFKLKFKKTEAFLGLRKMTLNNMVQDPSMLHETLAYAAFRAAGVPASRTGYAYVRLNGEGIGVYLNLENLDDIGLSRIFGSTFDQDTQHLYEGEYGDDVVPGGATDFEVDEGGDEPDEIGDLEALIEAVNGDGSEPWSQRIAPNADLAEMTKMWAVEKYIDHWDGYSGHAIPSFRPNNYYLYSDPAGRFQMLPWGTDQAWVPTIGVETPGREVTFDGEGGVLFNKCLEDEDCSRAYWEAVRDVHEAIVGLDPAAAAQAAADLLAPWQEEEREHGRPEYDAAETKEGKYGVDMTIEFILGRGAEAVAWLVANKPPSIPGAFTSPIVKDPPLVPAPALLFAHSGRTGRWVTARLQLSGPGSVGLRATMRTRKGTKRTCASSTQAGAAGELAVGCRLSRAALKRLEQGALRLALTFTLILADGRTETLVQNIRLPRVPD